MMKHWKKLTAALAATLGVIALILLTSTTNLGEKYGFDWQNYAPDIETKYSLTNAQQKFPAFYAWWKAKGYSDAKFMKLSELVCAHNNEVWDGHTGALTEVCRSRRNVEDPMGRYLIDFPLMAAFATYRGQGTSAFYYVGTKAQGSTELVLDIAGWQGDPADKNIFQSNTWGRDDLYSYHESFVIDGYRLVGSKASENYDPSYRSSGIAIWDAGSTSEIGRVFCENFNTAGVHLVRGTTSKINNLTSFRNNLAGIFIEGGGMHHFIHTEFDENPACIYVRGGHGRGAGAHIQVDYLKSETGIAEGRPVPKYQMIMDAEGWVNAYFGSIAHATITKYFAGIPHAMFRMKTDVNSSKLEVKNVQLFGPCYAWLQDANLGRVYPITPSNGINLGGYWFMKEHGFTFWGAWDEGLFKNDRGDVMTGLACAKNRIMGTPTVPETGAPQIAGWPNNAGGTPVYAYGESSAVTPACVIAYTVTQTGADGKWCRRTATVNPVGCATVPADSLTRTCAVAPPPTSSDTLYTITFKGKNGCALAGTIARPTIETWKCPTINGTVATTTNNTNVQFISSKADVKRIVLKGVSGAPSDYKWFNDVVRIKGGKFILASNEAVLSGTAVLNSTKKDIELNFPVAVQLSTLLGSSAYTTQVLSIEGIIILKK